MISTLRGYIPKLNPFNWVRNIITSKDNTTRNRDMPELSKIQATEINNLGQLTKDESGNIDPSFYQGISTVKNLGLLKAEKTDLGKSIEESIEYILNQVRKLNEGINVPINFNHGLISNALEEIFKVITNQSIEDLYQTGKQAIRDDSGAITNLSEKDQQSFLDVFDNFFALVFEVQKTINREILQKICDETQQANDLDLARSFQGLRNISAEISSLAIDHYNHLLNENLPRVKLNENEDSDILSKALEARFGNLIKLLKIGSKNGIQNKEIYETVNSIFTQRAESTKELDFNNLFVLKEFHKGTHGSLIITNQDPRQEEVIYSGDLSLELSSRAVFELADLIRKEVNIEDENQSRQIRSQINNLKNFVRDLATREHEVKISAQDLSDQDEFTTQYKEDLQNFNSFLGSSPQTNILGIDYPAKHMVMNLFDDNFTRQFERLINEISLLALIDANSTIRNRKKQDNEFLKHSPIFKTAPWLASFYKNEFDKYMRISKEQPDRVSSIYSEEICKLSSKLRKIGLFSSEKDFSKRYGIKKYTRAMLEGLGELTSVGLIAIRIRQSYSESGFYGTIDPKDTSLGLTPTEIKRLLAFLSHYEKLATIYDEHGRAVYDPPRPSKLADKKYHELCDVFAKTEFLTHNGKLITKFFLKSLEREKEKKANPKDTSDSNEHYIFLATSLAYDLLKFLPDTSNDIDSLEARFDVIKTVYQANDIGRKNIPEVIYRKLVDQFLGTDNNETIPDQNGKQGVLRSLCLDIKNKILAYKNKDSIEAHREGDINLKKLLDLYHRLLKLTKAADIDINQNYEDERRIYQTNLKVHHKIFKSKQPLLIPMHELLTEIIDKHLSTVVDFAYSSKDPRLKVLVANKLIEQNAELGEDLLQLQNQDNIVAINGDQANQVSKLTRFLLNMNYIAKLLVEPGYRKVKPNTELCNKIEKELGVKIKSEDIQTMQKFCKCKIKLLDSVDNQIENYPGKHKLKESLVTLLKKNKTGLKPADTKTHKWLNASQEYSLVG